ncbi:MAG: hypothetical protein JNG85_03955 [Spirochaetaceae bacterium]|nr:hypothetical protein [Spirochaetaceae bacterium]
MKIEDFAKLEWEDSGALLIAPPSPSPILADPTFLLPEESPDGNWVLFAHSAFGIRRYDSPDGLSWTDKGQAVPHGMRAFVRKFAGEYHLYYEQYPPFRLSLSLLPGIPWSSRIVLRRSKDLGKWSRPEPILTPTLPWHGGAKGPAAGNPCVFPQNGGYSLFYSAGLAYIPDCGFYEPAGIGRAHAEHPSGPFRLEHEPIFTVTPYERNLALSPGAMKVIPVEDGFVGFQNRIDWDEQGRSRSAIFLLGSADGLTWRTLQRDPLVSPDDAPGPDGKPWRSSHVYACDVRLNAADGRWYLYYNARNGWWKTSATEGIGRLVSR